MKKIIAQILAITLSLAGFSYGEIIQSPSNLYTVEKAIELTVKEYKKSKTTDIDQYKFSRQIESIKSNIIDLNYRGQITLLNQKDSIDPLVDSITALENSIENIDNADVLQVEVLKDTVKSMYLSIYKLQLQQKSLEQQIVLNEQLLKNDRKRVSLGLLSKVELDKNFNGYNKVIRQKESVRTSVEKLYISLKQLMGVASQDFIILDFSFIEKYEVVDLGSNFQKDMLESGNIKIKVLNNALTRSSDYYASLKDRYPRGSDNIGDADLELTKSRLTLENEVKALPYKYDNAIETVSEQYANYVQKKHDLSLKTEDSKIVTKKYELGNVSKMELNSSEITLKIEVINLELARMDYITARVNLDATLKGTN